MLYLSNANILATMQRLGLTVDRRGRVVIPKALRRILRLQAGDKLAVKQEGDGMILRPIRTGGLTKKYGVWVYSSPPKRRSLSAVELIERSRDKRIRELSK